MPKFALKLNICLLPMIWGVLAIGVSVKAAEVAPAVAPAAENHNKISGVPRLIRSHPETEIFFRDLNQSYIIPKDSHHNQIFEAVTKAMKTRSKVSLEVDSKSRRVLGLGEDSSAEKSKTSTDVLEKTP